MYGLAKTCNKCGHAKPLTAEFFYKQRSRVGHEKEGWQSHCKECWKSINKENKERRKHEKSGL